jgi:hypothetical protein
VADSPSSSPEPVTKNVEPKPPAVEVDCPKRAGDGAARIHGKARAADREAKGPEFNAKAFALYKEAAERGHLASQYEIGWRMFESLYMGDEPTPDQREEYVAALADIFGAGFRGYHTARENFPGVAEMLDAEKLSDELQQPLDEIPREWVAEAFAMALACKPPPLERRNLAPNMPISVELPDGLEPTFSTSGKADGKGGKEYLPLLELPSPVAFMGKQWIIIARDYPYLHRNKASKFKSRRTIERPDGSWLVYGVNPTTPRRTSNCNVRAWHEPSQTTCTSHVYCDLVPMAIKICMSIRAEGPPAKAVQETAESFMKRRWYGDKNVDVNSATPVIYALTTALMNDDRTTFAGLALPKLKIDKRRRPSANLGGKSLAAAVKLGCEAGERWDRPATKDSGQQLCAWIAYVVSAAEIDLYPAELYPSDETDITRRFTITKQANGEWRLSKVSSHDRLPRFPDWQR